jgi:transposase
MPKPHPDPKSTLLKTDGLLNPHPETVTDALFHTNAFFDARDLAQVKYEMLRRVSGEGQSKTVTAQAFGLSRPTLYQAQRAFNQHGLAGLLPRKRGPKDAHKLSAKVVAALEQQLTKDPKPGAAELAQWLARRFGLSVHPRSIQRALERKKKRQA